MRKGLLLLSFIFTLLCSNLLASESSTYDFSWLDPEKEVYVLQNRKFRKNKRLFITAGGGKTLSGAFVDSTIAQARIGYYFKEDWGVTILYSKNSGEENNTAKAIRANGAVPFRRIITNYQGVMVNWSPFYSKANFFNKVFYYDFILGAGLASLDQETNRTEVNNAQGTTVIDKESFTGSLFDIGIKFYITKNFSADMNLTALYYKGLNGVKASNDNSKEIYNSNWDLSFGLGYTF